MHDGNQKVKYKKIPPQPPRAKGGFSQGNRATRKDRKYALDAASSRIRFGWIGLGAGLLRRFGPMLIVVVVVGIGDMPTAV